MIHSDFDGFVYDPILRTRAGNSNCDLGNEIQNSSFRFSDFHSLETDVKKEISLRSKVGSSSSESVLISGLNLAPALEFERSDATRRLRLVLSELLAIMGSLNKEESSSNPSSTSITIKSSELFDHIVYLSEVCDVLAIAIAELPNLLSLPKNVISRLRLFL